jgi:H+/Cl- antiporter ClcA
MTSLNIPQTVFCLFFAIFWGLVANAQIRWKAFDWPLAWAGRKDTDYAPSCKRLWLSVRYLIILPTVLFVVFAVIFAKVPARGFGTNLVVQFLSSIVAAQVAFAPYRFWLSRIELSPQVFYYPDPINPLRYYTQPNSDSELPLALDPKWSHINRNVAWLYIVVSIVFAAVGYFFG